MTKPVLRVLVVGLLAQAQQAISREFPDVDVRFARENKRQLQYQDCDYIVLATKFIGHAHTNQAYKQFSRDKVVLASGGRSAIVRTIREVVQK